MLRCSTHTVCAELRFCVTSNTCRSTSWPVDRAPRSPPPTPPATPSVASSRATTSQLPQCSHSTVSALLRLTWICTGVWRTRSCSAARARGAWTQNRYVCACLCVCVCVCVCASLALVSYCTNCTLRLNHTGGTHVLWRGDECVCMCACRSHRSSRPCCSVLSVP